MSNNSSVSSNGSRSSVKSTLSSPRECSYNDKENIGNIEFKKLTGNSLKLYCNNYQEYLEKQAGFGAKKIHPKNRWGKATTINGKSTKYNLPETLCQCKSALAEEGMEFNYEAELEKKERESRPSSPGFGFGGKKMKRTKKKLRKYKKKSRKAVKKNKKRTLKKRR